MPNSASLNQRRALAEARRGNSFDTVRTLYDLISAGPEEPLAAEWRAVWTRTREMLEDGAVPAGILRQIDEAVAAIEYIDPQIGQVPLTEANRVCLLLGAGASAPAPSSIPTVNQLLPELWRRAGRIGREDIDRLSSWCKEHRITNIEDLLTAAYLANFAAKNASITGLLDYFLFRANSGDRDPLVPFREASRVRAVPRVDTSSIALLQDTLQVLFGLLTGTMIPASPNKGHESIVAFLVDHPTTSIVTTNYDGCVDEALARAGRELNSFIGDTTISAPSGAIDLIKIHGSINWSYCDSCHDTRMFPLLALKDSYQNDTASYAVIGICRACGGQRRPLLIPPMGLKLVMFPNLIRLWNTARERIEDADVIVVVGFSFSEADSYINKIIERSLSRKATQRMIVCDPNAGLVPALRSRLAARIDAFDEKRIAAAIGSGDEVLPIVLERLQGKAVAPSRPSTHGSRRRNRGATIDVART